MSDPKPLAVGDKVRVFDINGRRNGQPNSGWPGEVVKIGRVYATIQYNGGRRQFGLSDHRAHDAWGHQSFQTMEEVSLGERRDSAWATLKGAGIARDGYGCGSDRVPLDLLEALAAVVTARWCPMTRPASDCEGLASLLALVALVCLFVGAWVADRWPALRRRLRRLCARRAAALLAAVERDGVE